MWHKEISVKYPTGEVVQIGDDVLIENGVTFGSVEHIIETDKDMAEWNVSEPGVILKSKPFGSVFWPIEKDDGSIIFVSRNST